MLHTNIVHRVDTTAHSLESLHYQRKLASDLAVPVTSLISYNALFDKTIMDNIRSPDSGNSEEFGLHFWNYKSERFHAKYQTREQALWLLPRSIRTALIDEMMQGFHEQFGHFPTSVGCYIIDAWTLSYIKAHYPSVKIAINSCFEEGVKMYYGNNRNWMLFSDGGPWNPYYPSRHNAMVPAASEDESIGIIAVPHLNRDMIMALTSRDDIYASHPGNLVRGRLNQNNNCPYQERFTRAWARQAQLNGWSYLNIFVSSPWLSDKHWANQNYLDTRDLYRQLLVLLKDLEADGENSNQTMNDFADAFPAIHRPGDATICHWKDELMQGKREVLWTVNSHYRAAFDFNIGGTLVDLRPFAGRIEHNLGPETPARWNGNQPFAISAEHKGGHWNSGMTGELQLRGEKFAFSDRRTRISVEYPQKNQWIATTEPLRVDLAGARFEVVSQWQGSCDGVIQLKRIITEVEGDIEGLLWQESFSGAWATREYPEDLRGAELIAERWDNQKAPGIALDYQSRTQTIDNCRSVGIHLPQAHLSITLEAESEAIGFLDEGFLFSPSYRFRLSIPLTPQTQASLWLKQKKS